VPNAASTRVGPNMPGTSLRSVAASSSSDLWAVGGALIERLDGSSWRVVAHPAGRTGELDDVAALSADDAWAVGHVERGGHYRTLIEHWDGERWRLAPSPNPPATYLNDYLNGVSGIDPNDVWAVGYSNSGGDASQSLIEHWDGRRWRIVPSANFPYPGTTGRSELQAVAAISRTDVWAVGGRDVTCCGAFLSLVEHFDGTNWSIVSSPNVGGFSGFVAVAARSADDVLAVGVDNAGTLIEHWDGTTWHIIPSPNIPTVANALDDVATLPSAAWAVGSNDYLASRRQALIEQHA
jgi:hypothetical protein